MKNEILVSVITPVYNAEKYISDAIESILSQSFKNFEYIIIDDASTDNTVDIVESFLEKDSRIILIKNESNLDIAETRNKGIKKAKGKYIVWQDADDISRPSRIEKQFNFMEDNKNVGICGGFMEIFSKEKSYVRKYPISDKVLRRNIFRFSPVAQPVAILRKKVFGEIGFYNKSLSPAEDLEMSFRVGEKYKFANIPEILLEYRIHESSATSQRLRRQINLTSRIRNKYKNSSAYDYNILDWLANGMTNLMKNLPYGITIEIFNKLRRMLLVFSLNKDK